MLSILSPLLQEATPSSSNSSNINLNQLRTFSFDDYPKVGLGFAETALKYDVPLSVKRERIDNLPLFSLFLWIIYRVEIFA